MMKRIFSIFIGVILVAGCDIPEDDRATYDSQDVSERIDSCRAYNQYTHRMVEDFELGIAATWWLSSDGTGEITPMVGREPEAAQIDGGRCGVSNYALRIQARDTVVYGGGFGMSFMPEPWDVSEYDGISFWAKRGAESKTVLFVSITDPNTDEYNSMKQSADGVPACYEVTDDDSEKCDRFGIGVGLETEWKMYFVPFEELSQQGYGMEVDALDTSEIYGFNISFGLGTFDVWIDDIAFYKE